MTEQDKETVMTDKPEAVAWMYRHKFAPSLCHIVEARWTPDIAAGWHETTLYAHPPAQPDASALVEALIRIRDLPDLDRPITDHLQASNYATQVARAALAAYRGGDNG